MTKEDLMTKKVSAISLGCDKNKVDLEKMLGKIKLNGMEIVSDPTESDIVIVNTCSFILPAEEEAINHIIEMENLREKGVIEKLIVSGCFPERHFNAISSNFPHVDLFMRLQDNENIVNLIEKLYAIEPTKQKPTCERVLTNPSAYAYLKIADGCNNACAYCTIPRIRGRYKSTPMEQLIDEAKMLADRGVKELILVAQDTTRYGEDLYGHSALIELCEKLSKIKNIKWIRLHYAYPEKVTKELLDFIVTNPKMCRYLDIPLQHIDDAILKSMRRRLSETETRELIKLIQTDYPEIKIRSTFIAGYPAETGKNFKKLCNFLAEVKLDYVGFFPYSREPNTAAYYIKKQVHKFVKQRRVKRLQTLQMGIAFAKAFSQMQQEVEVLVDSFDETLGEFIGHSQYLSPSVDFGIRFVDNGNIQIGDFVTVRLFDFDGDYFKGEVV